jgi:hypothetical protein
MGTSAASHGASPKHSACAIPNLGLQNKRQDQQIYQSTTSPLSNTEWVKKRKNPN